MEDRPSKCEVVHTRQKNQTKKLIEKAPHGRACAVMTDHFAGGQDASRTSGPPWPAPPRALGQIRARSPRRLCLLARSRSSTSSSMVVFPFQAISPLLSRALFTSGRAKRVLQASVGCRVVFDDAVGRATPFQSERAKVWNRRNLVVPVLCVTPERYAALLVLFGPGCAPQSRGYWPLRPNLFGHCPLLRRLSGPGNGPEQRRNR